MNADAKARSEERILRFWTPVLLRGILVLATIIMVAGLIIALIKPSGYYVNSFHEVQLGRAHHSESFLNTVRQALSGDPQALMTVGLMVLTLVPLARVLFCFLLFLLERDWIYVIFTAYVLIGLIIGVALGKIG